MFQLRFMNEDILHWASHYPAVEDWEIEQVIAPHAREHGYFTKPEFLRIL